jgi:hypothetical protein
MKKLAAILALCLMVICGAPVMMWAGSTDYNVSIAVGSGSVSGFIQTNGAVGTLSAADITNWNLLLNDGSSSFDLVGSNSQLLVGGTSFSATATDLLFNFSNSSSDFVLFQNPSIGSSENWLCFEGTSNGCSGSPSSINLRVGFGSVQILGETGVQVVATSATVPEPGSFVLLGVNLLGAALIGQAWKVCEAGSSSTRAAIVA